jgi:hypothetical protein
MRFSALTGCCDEPESEEFDGEEGTTRRVPVPLSVVDRSLGVLVAPIIASFVLSLTDYDTLSDPEWVGQQKYREMLFEDRTFWVSIRVTLKYLVSVPLNLLFGLVISLILNLKIRGINFFRTILFLPGVFSGVAVAVPLRARTRSSSARRAESRGVPGLGADLCRQRYRRSAYGSLGPEAANSWPLGFTGGI